jgi:uncharacterized protein (TIGR02996 family)
MTHAGFLAAILAEPERDDVRLIYADWLEDNGDPDRAEFIRVQCRITAVDAALEDTGDCNQPDCPGCVERRALRRRERELLELSEGGARWLPEDWPLWPVPPGRWDVAFHRGFVAEVTLPCAEWLRHGRELVRAAPLERVALADVPVYPVDGERQRAYLNRERVPAEIWPLLDARSFGANWKRFPSHVAALESLSRACLKWARDPAPAAH